MSTPSNSKPTEKTPIEATGHIAGTLTAMAQMMMPIRLWMTFIASTVLVVFAYRSESLLDISRALCLFVAFISLLVGSAVFSKKSK